jgi:hypothetical protein
VNSFLIVSTNVTCQQGVSSVGRLDVYVVAGRAHDQRATHELIRGANRFGCREIRNQSGLLLLDLHSGTQRGRVEGAAFIRLRPSHAAVMRGFLSDQMAAAAAAVHHLHHLWMRDGRLRRHSHRNSCRRRGRQTASRREIVLWFQESSLVPRKFFGRSSELCVSEAVCLFRADFLKKMKNKTELK